MKRTTLAIAILLSTALAVSTSAAPLSVLTYNVGLLRVFGSDFVPMVRERARVAPREIARFAAERSPDLIVLEEIWTDAQAKAMSEALTPLGYDLIGPKRCTLIGRESGLLVAIRQPIRVVSWSYIPFGKSTFIDSLARKGILQAVLEYPGAGAARFVLLATHTVAVDTDRGIPTDEEQVAAVEAQARMILALLDQASASGDLPGLLVGDFNVGPGYADAVYRLIAEAPGIREAGAAAALGAGFITWDPANTLVRYGRYPNEPAAKLDHVFFRDGSTARWQAIEVDVVFTRPVDGLALVPEKGAAAVPAQLSDHYGFLATLDLAGAR